MKYFPLDVEQTTKDN